MNYKKQSINTLIESCKKKNHKAQMELYQRFNRSLNYSAYQIVENQEDAVDVKAKTGKARISGSGDISMYAT